MQHREVDNLADILFVWHPGVSSPVVRRPRYQINIKFVLALQWCGALGVLLIWHIQPSNIIGRSSSDTDRVINKLRMRENKAAWSPRTGPPTYSAIREGWGNNQQQHDKLAAITIQSLFLLLLFVDGTKICFVINRNPCIRFASSTASHPWSPLNLSYSHPSPHNYTSQQFCPVLASYIKQWISTSYSLLV